ncbi:MAG: recombinase RecQ, partial [Micrococcaceae bacterium]|nr:recombinase RecQ [Micrococcaceae bacterium]
PHGGPRGASGGNSAFRLAAVWGQFAVGDELAGELAALDGPVLLIDDYVDSRWTITEATRVLREAGADAVLPFVLAVSA